MKLDRIIPLSLLAASLATVAQTQAAAVEIAYIKAGSSHEIYGINADGSGFARLYTGPRRTSLSWVDLQPGGSALAFTQGLSVRIHSGQPNAPASAIPGAPCATTHSPDYHPSGDGRLVFIAACGFGNFQVMTYTSGDAQPALLFTISAANRIRWSRTGDYLIYDEAVSPTSATMKLKRRNVATGVVEDFGAITGLNSFDVTRTGERLVFGTELAPKLFDFATMTDTSQATALGCDGNDIHFAPDDSRMVYETPHVAKGTFVLIKNSNCSGSPNALTGKGDWHSKDWRPNAVTP